MPAAQAAPAKKARTQAKSVAKAPPSASSARAARAGKPKVVVLRSAPQAPADVPRLPTSTFRQGCMPVEALDSLAQAVPEPARATLLPVADAAPASVSCVPYASVALSGGGSELLAVLPPADGGSRRALLIERGASDAQRPVARWQELDALAPDVREVWSTVAAMSDGAAPWTNGVPAPLRRELAILVREMRQQTGADESAQVRMLVAGDEASARLLAVELLDGQGARSLDTAVWVPRDEGPGAYVSALGVDYERALWQSPVEYRRISRGVGTGTVFIRQRVAAASPARAKSRTVVRSFVRKGQHIGIDFAAPSGTPVVAVADGTVSFAGWRGGYGNLLIIDHGAGLSTYYGHLSATEAGVVEGAAVRRGMPIGQVGATGWATGPHLHFEVRKDGRYMDPADPEQQLAPWVLQRGEHERFLTRLLLLAQPGGVPSVASADPLVPERPLRAMPVALRASTR